MPNVTSVWDFSPGETLTAAKLDDVNCGIHVFSGTATRDAAYGGSGERALSEGEFAYLADTNTTQYYDGAAWQTVGGGLTLIKTQTIGTAVSSVAVTDAFSATYDSYFITISGGVASGNVDLKLTLGATATGYYYGLVYVNLGGNTALALSGSNTTSWAYAGSGSSDALSFQTHVDNPFATKRTMIRAGLAQPNTAGAAGSFNGFLADNTSYTAFTIAPSSGTITGGIIRVYGYQNS